MFLIVLPRASHCSTLEAVGPVLTEALSSVRRSEVELLFQIFEVSFTS